MKNKIKLSKFETGYIECLLWSSTDNNDEPLDSKFCIEDLSDEFIQQCKNDCYKFIEAAGELLDSLDDSQAGYDFWLTRNRHGTGFWDRGHGLLGKKLTQLSHEAGELFPYVGDDGRLYL